MESIQATLKQTTVADIVQRAVQYAIYQLRYRPTWIKPRLVQLATARHGL